MNHEIQLKIVDTAIRPCHNHFMHTPKLTERELHAYYGTPYDGEDADTGQNLGDDYEGEE